MPLAVVFAGAAARQLVVYNASLACLKPTTSTERTNENFF
jgi:hypothetical protein